VTRRDPDERTADSPENAQLDPLEWHLHAALDAVTDRHGRYHLREALQLLHANDDDVEPDDGET